MERSCGENLMINKKRARIIINVIMALTTVAVLFFLFYGEKTNLFHSQAAMETFLNKFGIGAPTIFILFQAIQVIFPILPGGIGLLGGVLIFGPWKGFIYNYIGICLGSVIAFLISKHFGPQIVESLFSEKMQKKYMKWAENKDFPNLFAIAIFMPIAPDDFLCYLAGTTKMTLKRFTTIILLGKPMAIAAYSFGLNFFFQHMAILIR